MSSKMRSVLSALVLLSAPFGLAQIVGGRDIVGVNHIGGRYTFNTPWPVPAGDTNKRDYLNEGAVAISALGSRVIKVQLHPNPKSFYWYTQNPGFPFGFPFFIPPEGRLANMAQSTQYTELWSGPFTTYVINVMANLPLDGPDEGNEEDIQEFGSYLPILDGMTSEEVDAEREALKSLAAYFLQNYAGSGKTFVIANGEGDQIMRNFGRGGVPPPTEQTAAAMIAWINARQRGVSDARAQYPASGVTVVYGCEVSSIRNAIQGIGITMANHVVPSTECDLYSYTPYDYGNDRDEGDLIEALNYLAAKAWDEGLYGKHNLYLGEYAFGENGDLEGDANEQERRIRRSTEAAIGFGCRYVLYWQLYDNEPCDPAAPPPCEYNENLWPCPEPPDPNDPDCERTVDPNDVRPTNNQMRGLWLVRPDGSHAPVYNHLQNVIGYSYFHVGLRTYSGHYVSVDDAGGSVIHVNGMWLREWEYVTIVDRNGGDLVDGDSINILTQDGHYVMAQDNGGGAVYASAPHALTWETFTIDKLNGGGLVGHGDPVAIRAGTGHYFVAEGGGGGANVLNANRVAIGPWETFTIVDASLVTAGGAFAPSVDTLPPSAVQSTSATLRGTVNPNGGSTTTAFEYGTTTAYGATISSSTLAGPVSQVIETSISGLACGTLYHARARAQNEGGVTLGPDVVFTTAACPAVSAPTGLTATAVSFTEIAVSWNASAGATEYEIMRASSGGSYVSLTTTPLTHFNDTSAAAGHAYVYKVRQLFPSSSPFSIPDAALTIIFTDDPLSAMSTPVRASHVVQLRDAVSALREAAGLSAPSFTDPVSSSVAIKAVHLTELRTALNQARSALGLPVATYADGTLYPTATIVKAVHIQELRQLVK